MNIGNNLIVHRKYRSIVGGLLEFPDNRIRATCEFSVTYDTLLSVGRKQFLVVSSTLAKRDGY